MLDQLLDPDNLPFAVSLALMVMLAVKIVQVDGLTQRGESANGGAASGSGNLVNDAVSAALTYRAQAPVIDSLMKELGLDGSIAAVLRSAVPSETAIADRSSAAEVASPARSADFEPRLISSVLQR